MFGRLAANGIAVLLISLPVCAGALPAFAQYQTGAVVASLELPLDHTQIVREPFGLAAAPVSGGEVLAKWNGLVADIRAEGDILTRCRNDAQFCPAAAQKFLAVIAEGRAHEGRARLGVINRAINLAIRPVSDLAQWGVEDRWTAPLATLTAGGGDCEDYAIAKYVALIEAGVGEDDVKLIIVRDLALGQDHAVVAARLDDKWIVLDNRRLALLDDVDMPRVEPLFVLDRGGVRQFTPTAVAQAAAVKDPAPSALGF
jgi:predicted transglutaminase-like cysteine proteinase